MSNKSRKSAAGLGVNSLRRFISLRRVALREAGNRTGLPLTGEDIEFGSWDYAAPGH